MLTRDTVSHHVQGDIWAPPRTRVRALCGASVPIESSTMRPSCPICRLRLQRLEELDRAIDTGLSNWDRAVK